MRITNTIISVIIPTHNRAEALLQALEALVVQIFAKSEFEVIVVADGCTDKTVEMVKGYRAPYKLQILEQEGSGAAAARNKGAAIADGSLLLFLDDDIISSPQLVDAHVKAHQQAVNQVVIGYLPPVLQNQKGYFRTKLKAWWEDVFYPMHHTGYSLTYRNLLSGNFSLPAQLFDLVGGFNASFKCQEDYELGVRLIQARAQFVFAPEAMGYHNETTDLNRWLYRKYSEGKAAVQFCHEYPQLFDTIPVLNQFNNGFPTFYQNTLQLIQKWNILAACIAIIYRCALNILEWLRMRELWEKLLGRLQIYWSLKGMLDAAGDLDSLINLLKDASSHRNEPPSITEIDMGLKRGQSTECSKTLK